MALTVVLATPLLEGTTGVYTFHPVNEDGAGIDQAELNTCTLTVVDVATGAILNGRDTQNILNANNVTLTTVTVPTLRTTLTWELQPTDTVRHDVLREVEKHLAVFAWSWAGSTKHAGHKAQFSIEALIYTLVLP